MLDRFGLHLDDFVTAKQGYKTQKDAVREETNENE
jgi:hypothetical protein